MRPQLLETLPAQDREFVQERDEAAPGVPGPMPEAIVRLEDRVRPAGEDDPRPWHPVGLFAVDEVPDVVERTEVSGPSVVRI